MVLVLKLSWHALVASKLVLDTWQGTSYQATSDANGWGKWARDPRLPACRIVLPKTWRISKDCTMSHLHPFATALPHEKLQHFGQQVQLLHQEVLVLEHPHVCKALPWTHHWKRQAVKMKAASRLHKASR